MAITDGSEWRQCLSLLRSVNGRDKDRSDRETQSSAYCFLYKRIDFRQKLFFFFKIIRKTLNLFFIVYLSIKNGKFMLLFTATPSNAIHKVNKVSTVTMSLYISKKLYFINPKLFLCYKSLVISLNHQTNGFTGISMQFITSTRLLSI